MAAALDLFRDQPRAEVGPFHARGSDTSRAAAERVTHTLAYRQMAVVRQLRMCGPLTGEQIADRLGEQTYRVLPRLTELSRMTPPRVRKTEERRTNRSGSSATVWEVIP